MCVCVCWLDAGEGVVVCVCEWRGSGKRGGRRLRHVAAGAALEQVSLLSLSVCALFSLSLSLSLFLPKKEKTGEDGYSDYAQRAKTHELKNIDQRVRTGDLSQVLCAVCKS